MVNPQYNDLVVRKIAPTASKPAVTRPLLVIFASVLVVIFSVVLNKTKVSTYPETATRASESNRDDLFDWTKHQVPRKEILQNVKTELEKVVGTYSIYVYDFNLGQGYGLNEHTVFMAGSISKVPILVALYLLTQDGKVNLNETVTLQKDDIQDYGTGVLRYEGLGKTYTIKALAQLMMEKSDNTAAYVIANQVIGYPALNGFIRDWHLEQTDMAENTTTNFDMAELFIKLQQNSLVHKPYLAEMFDFMKDTDFEDRIPAQLPEGTTVYHKTGDQASVSHDVGIVELSKHPYYIGILTSNMIAEESAVKEAMARVSRIIYDHQLSL